MSSIERIIAIREMSIHPIETYSARHIAKLLMHRKKIAEFIFRWEDQTDEKKIKEAYQSLDYINDQIRKHLIL